MANQEPKTQTIAETDNYLAWSADEPDGEKTYHLELNNVTLHFFSEPKCCKPGATTRWAFCLKNMSPEQTALGSGFDAVPCYAHRSWRL